MSSDMITNGERERPEFALLLAKERINVRNAGELELWTEILDVYVGDIVNAVGEVGNESLMVLDYLLSNDIIGKRSRTPEPTPRPYSAD